MYALYALRNFHILPGEFGALPLREKAMLMAMVDEIRRRDRRRAERRGRSRYIG